MKSDPKIIRAMTFARHYHAGQTRRYTGEPYLNHLVNVFSLVTSVPHTEDMLIAALLHDAVEDTKATIWDVEIAFGSGVANLVKMLTDAPETGNRAARTAMNIARMANASKDAKTIKLADILDNLKDIREKDPDYAAKVYIPEKARMLAVLSDGDPTLYRRAKALIDGT